MPIWPPRASVRAVFSPTGVPPRFSSLCHSKAFLASSWTDAGMVYSLPEAVITFMSRLDSAPLASSMTASLTVQVFLLLHLCFFFMAAVRPLSTMTFRSVSTTTEFSACSMRTREPSYPIISGMLVLFVDDTGKLEASGSGCGNNFICLIVSEVRDS